MDSWLNVAYARAQEEAAERDLVRQLKQLPADELQDLAMGKLAYLGAYGGDKNWLEKYLGSPLFPQAVELEQQEIQVEAMDQAQRAQDDQRQQVWKQRDQLCLQKRLLDLQLMQVQQAEMGGVEPPQQPMPEQAAPPGADAAGPPMDPAKQASAKDTIMDALRSAKGHVSNAGSAALEAAFKKPENVGDALKGFAALHGAGMAAGVGAKHLAEVAKKRMTPDAATGLMGRAGELLGGGRARALEEVAARAEKAHGAIGSIPYIGAATGDVLGHLSGEAGTEANKVLMARLLAGGSAVAGLGTAIHSANESAMRDPRKLLGMKDTPSLDAAADQIGREMAHNEADQWGPPKMSSYHEFLRKIAAGMSFGSRAVALSHAPGGKNPIFGAGGVHTPGPAPKTPKPALPPNERAKETAKAMNPNQGGLFAPKDRTQWSPKIARMRKEAFGAQGALSGLGKSFATANRTTGGNLGRGMLIGGIGGAVLNSKDNQGNFSLGNALMGAAGGAALGGFGGNVAHQYGKTQDLGKAVSKGGTAFMNQLGHMGNAAHTGFQPGFVDKAKSALTGVTKPLADAAGAVKDTASGVIHGAAQPFVAAGKDLVGQMSELGTKTLQGVADAGARAVAAPVQNAANAIHNVSQRAFG